MKETIDHAKWTDVLSAIRGMVSEVSYKTWIVTLKPLYRDEESGIFALASTDRFKTNLIRQRYMNELQTAVNQVFHRNYNITVEHLSSEEISDIVTGKKEKKKNLLVPKNEEAFREEYYLNPKYTFENFVVGSNNNYAHAVSLAVAEDPANTYNPLFIYGGSGLGKTHLMHAIGNYVQEHNPEMKVLYVASEMFTSELINAINNPGKNNSRMNAFKQKYRSVDIFLIDDIQFIEGKEATQEELFHTFNTLYEFQKQIVISSDRHPSKLTRLDDRLKSRFQWNIVADVQYPDFETRVAILRNKAKQEGVEMDDDFLQVLDLIAEKVKFNIRELESALTRVISFSAVVEDKPKINVAFAKKNLPDIFNTRDSTINCEKIKKAVCNKYNIKMSDMESNKRKREFTHPRQVAMYLCREMTDLSLPQIGESFGGRDHTTVLHAYKKIEDEMKVSSLLAEEIRIIKEDLS
ncbi:MAG: chromosomal replication initiator protein DnaA [Firmicutes bacterium]|nr:chromosomal replication initiator protein DnaA [Bacillota bacterium]